MSNEAIVSVIGSARRLNLIYQGLSKFVERERRLILTGPQAFLLASMQDGLRVTQLMNTDCYSGSNISYNLRKLEELGLLKKDRNPNDERSIIVTRTKKGLEIGILLAEMLPGMVEQVDATIKLAA